MIAKLTNQDAEIIAQLKEKDKIERQHRETIIQKKIEAEKRHDLQLDRSLQIIQAKAKRSEYVYAKTIEDKTRRAIEINHRMQDTTERAIKF